MKLIIGLGNPGPKYANNRHNVGYLAVDYLADTPVAKSVVLKKTGEFMNNSGLAVARYINYYKLSTSDLYIVHDDLDIKLGEYKIQFGVGPKLHNGIESIETKLKTQEFWRVRVGVDNRGSDNRIPGEKYVLQDFTKEEIKILHEVFRKVEHFLLHPLIPSSKLEEG